MEDSLPAQAIRGTSDAAVPCQWPASRRGPSTYPNGYSVASRTPCRNATTPAHGTVPRIAVDER